MKDHKVMKTFLGVLKDYDEAFKKLANKKISREELSVWFRKHSVRKRR